MDATATFAAPVSAPTPPDPDGGPFPRDRDMAEAVRSLLAGRLAPGQARPGAAMLAVVDAAAALWTRYLRFDAADPNWPDRDRFVLSADRSLSLLCALLHLTGVAGVQAGEGWPGPASSVAAGAAALGHHPAVEAMAGPIGQGLATAVGMALAERLMAARFGRSLVDHRTWVVAAPGDLMDGVSHEAISLAGHLRLEKLTVLYAEQTDDMGGAQACSTDQLRRFASHGWAVKQVDGSDPGQIASAMSFAIRSKKPTFIACRADPAEDAALSGGGRPGVVSPHVAERWLQAGRRSAGARRAWLKRLARHPLRPEFERVLAGRLPDSWYDVLASQKAGFAEAGLPLSCRQAGQQIIEALAPVMPELVGGSSLSDAGQGMVRGMGLVGPGNFGGRTIHFGVRDHCMAATANGMAAHGGLIPCGGTHLAASDHMRPALRMGALTRQRVIHMLTYDPPGGSGGDPLNQPLEHLASIRAMPGLFVFRPADAVETAECWELALRRAGAPSLLLLSNAPSPALRADAGENRCARGAYVLAEAEGPRQATLITTGTEVAAALDARERLAIEGIAVAVVSLPCWELFAVQHSDIRAQILGGVPRFGIEAAHRFGWDRWLGEEGVFIGLTGFDDARSDDPATMRHGLTGDAIAEAVLHRLRRT